MTATFFFLMPMIYLSGFIFPIENMPAVIQPFTYLIPLRYFLVIVRGDLPEGRRARDCCGRRRRRCRLGRRRARARRRAQPQDRALTSTRRQIDVVAIERDGRMRFERRIDGRGADPLASNGLADFTRSPASPVPSRSDPSGHRCVRRRRIVTDDAGHAHAAGDDDLVGGWTTRGHGSWAGGGGSPDRADLGFGGDHDWGRRVVLAVIDGQPATIRIVSRLLATTSSAASCGWGGRVGPAPAWRSTRFATGRRFRSSSTGSSCAGPTISLARPGRCCGGRRRPASM